MVFSLRNPVDRGANPFTNIVSNAMKTRQEWEKAKYAGQQQQADIFSKKIGPMAQIAISPMFSLLPKEQQEQFAHIMQRSMAEQEPHQKARGLLSGLTDKVSQMFGGSGNQESTNQGQGNGQSWDNNQPRDQGNSNNQGQVNNESSNQGIPNVNNPVPNSMAESAMQPYAGSKIPPGTPYMTQQGIKFSPTIEDAKAAQQLSAVGIGNFDKNLQEAEELGLILSGAGKASRNGSIVAGEVSKLGPWAAKYTEKYGSLANIQSRYDAIRAMLDPQLDALKINPQQRESLIGIQPGENADSTVKRFQRVNPYIYGRVNSTLQAVEGGIPLAQSVQQNRQEQQTNEPAYGEERQPPKGSHKMVTFEDGSTGFISADEKTVKAFRRDHPNAKVGG